VEVPVSRLRGFACKTLRGKLRRCGRRKALRNRAGTTWKEVFPGAELGTENWIRFPFFGLALDGMERFAIIKWAAGPDLPKFQIQITGNWIRMKLVEGFGQFNSFIFF
jgi:hypothetical protein